MEQPCNRPPVYMYGEADRRNLLQQYAFYFVTEVHPELNFSVFNLCFCRKSDGALTRITQHVSPGNPLTWQWPENT